MRADVQAADAVGRGSGEKSAAVGRGSGEEGVGEEGVVRRRLSRADRRAQILRVAEQVFSQRGYQGTALEDIAASAGVTRPLIYNYFADKDELYLECLHAARGELEAAIVAAAQAHMHPRDMLRAGMIAYFTFVAERGKRWDMLFGGGIAVAGTVAERAEQMRFETVEKIAALVRAAAPGHPAQAAVAYAHAMSGAGEQLAKWWRRNPHIPLGDIVQYHFDTVWTGLQQVAEG